MLELPCQMVEMGGKKRGRDWKREGTRVQRVKKREREEKDIPGPCRNEEVPIPGHLDSVWEKLLRQPNRATVH